MVKLTSVALAVAGVVALGSTGVVSSSERGGNSDTFRSADDLNVHKNMRGSNPHVPDMVSHSHMDNTMDSHEAARADRMGDQQRGEDQMWDKAAAAIDRAVSTQVLDALKTPSNDGCAKFAEIAKIAAGAKRIQEDVPFLREQCLDDHGLTYFTRNEMILAENIKNGNKRFDVLSREALVNHRLNQVDSCKQLLRTGRHMRSVYKANEGDILQARIDHMQENDPHSEGTEDQRDEQENEIVDEEFKDLLDVFKDGQLRPFVAPMSLIADKCMNDLLNDQGCNEKQKNTFIDNHGPGFKDDIEDYITTSQGTPLMDVLHALSVASDIVCNPPMSRASY